MAESVAYKLLKKHMPQPKDRLDRVENVCVDGMPDVNFTAQGVESWIEMKSPVEPKRPTTPLFGSNHKVSQSQMNWMLRQRQAGGRCWILICSDKRWILINGHMADDVNKMTVDELIEQAAWYCVKPIPNEMWIELRRTLCSK